MASDILTSLAAAVQASLSVLLTISYGVIAGQTRLLDESAAKRISRMCVNMLLPALLIVNLGSELHASTAMRYVPIFVWAIVYNLLSLGIGMVGIRLFKLPQWVLPATSCNNTTSLPLLLMQSLKSTTVLSQLLRSPDDSVSEVYERTRSYFLVSAVVSNIVTFGLGKDLLGVHDEDPADELDEQLHNEAGLRRNRISGPQQDTDANDSGQDSDGAESGEGSDARAHEGTSLLPGPLSGYTKTASRKGYKATTLLWDKLPSLLKATIARVAAFISPTLVGAAIGAILGLTPALHRVFFADTEDGGYFKAWLTISLQNIGELFVALQVIVVGVKLAHSLRRMRSGESSGKLPWSAMLFTLTIRFVVWPIISIIIISTLASKTSVLTDDPVLWFVMMVMPAGPSAMILTALGDSCQVDEEEKMAIAKFLTVSYGVSPLISFTVVASLKACSRLIQGAQA